MQMVSFRIDFLCRSIQIDELVQGLGAVGCPRTSDLKVLFEKMDIDKSGDLDIAEVICYCSSTCTTLLMLFLIGSSSLWSLDFLSVSSVV